MNLLIWLDAQPREMFVKICDEKSLSAVDDLVALFFEPFSERFHAAGILGIQFTAGLEGAPVWRDPGFAISAGFFGGVGRDPREDAGGDVATDRRPVFLRD